MERWEAIDHLPRCHSVTITNLTGAVKAGDLLLVWTCLECRGDVERVVESS
jgi:hypothetical protein